MYYSCLENYGACVNITRIRPLDSVVVNGTVRSTILKLGNLGCTPRSKIRYSAIEFFSSFDHINLPANRLSNTKISLLVVA